MKIVLMAGEQITVTFEGTDGEITVASAVDRVFVDVDMPDDQGREGRIYEEIFDDGTPDVDSGPEEAVVWGACERFVSSLVGGKACTSCGVLESRHK